jgi:hypothetical protein
MLEAKFHKSITNYTPTKCTICDLLKMHGEDNIKFHKSNFAGEVISCFSL